MPFIASRDGESVIPEQVEDGEDVWCRACLERMRARGPFEDGTARHFYHVENDQGGAGCRDGSPGESATHLKWKSWAVSALRQRYDNYHVCAPEVPIDVTRTETETDERRADALLEFNERNRFYGNGIIVEVQHLNVSKDIRGTTHDYLQEGYSVYWATEDDFENDRFDLERMEEAFNEGRRSAFSVYRSEPPRLDAPEPLSVTEGEEKAYTTVNPVPECSHEFVPAPEGSVCLRCGLELRLCIYDSYREELRPSSNYSHRVRAERVLAANTASIERPIEFEEIEEYGDPPDDHSHHWGHSKDLVNGEKHHCRYCDATLMEGVGRIVLNHE
ncbi:hypothetical protein [Natrinema versiforme]|uniref:Competence CoiA family protein n=1 Tax=Natrinema versiforme JCM 10478 TaxID=1227496 RepID=L9Y466_9EURY|nr:hypothetical protein [Natrinema versiforme]ELY68860.1 hypothetical protein C489_05823 [Natrinema versiforme JCM 10478]